MKSFNVIGFGKMGIQISSLLLILGYKVNIWTRNFKIKQKKFHINNKIFKKSFNKNISGQFNIYENLNELPKNDTIETIVENKTIKQDILSKIKYELNDVIFFTNTSSYSPNEINKNAIGLHFFNPIHQIKVIETTCSEEIINNHAKVFFNDLKNLKFKIFKVKSNRGYIFNYLYFKKIALFYELIEKYNYNPKEITELLDSIQVNNDYGKIVNLVGSKTVRNIISNLLENENNIINIPKNI